MVRNLDNFTFYAEINKKIKHSKLQILTCIKGLHLFLISSVVNFDLA